MGWASWGPLWANSLNQKSAIKSIYVIHIDIDSKGSKNVKGLQGFARWRFFSGVGGRGLCQSTIGTYSMQDMHSLTALNV